MLRFLVRMLVVFGLLFVLALGAGGYAGYRFLLAPADLPETIVLRIDLDGALPEHGRGDPLASVVLGEGPSLRGLVDALDRGRIDDRVKGLLMRFNAPRITFAQAEELRAAVERFRQAGRFAYAFADTFGEFGPAHDAYYLASAFERVWLQPVGMVGLTGLSSEIPFARKLLDEWGVQPEIDHRKEYKSAAESLTESGITPAHREMMASLLDDLGDQLYSSVGASRGLDAVTLRRMIDRGPLLDQEALAGRLVDQLGYFDQALAAAKARAGKGAALSGSGSGSGSGTGTGAGKETGGKAPGGKDGGAREGGAREGGAREDAGNDVRVVEALDYLGAAGSPYDDGPTVALIYAVGELHRGRGSEDPVLGDRVVGADTVVGAFDEAIEDEAVKAILFRISSPGGSPVASESIRRAVLRAREKGKPVVVSMGDTGASGGYWIAMNANRIVADGTTLTGSIGVLAGKVVTAGLWQKLGINWGVIADGRNAGIWSSLSPYSDSERERLGALLDSHYAAFTERAVEARGLEPQRLEAVAKGRVWTGRQAVKRGLIDEVGDVWIAIARIREALKLTADAPVHLREFPRPRTSLQRLLEAVGVRAGVGAVLPPALTAVLRPLIAGDSGAARMPEIGLIR